MQISAVDRATENENRNSENRGHVFPRLGLLLAAVVFTAGAAGHAAVSSASGSAPAPAVELAANGWQ
ncbi:hypothetical protein PJ985_00520 [Streptomyces sp. ACA25]|uniref:hypothetical protein n=1 Tax=Streptomyces sp. ACA25 TaxID=3022596 RepID=UPI002307A382|nr:hypothetical protein [Streptomyces sp. ACA25]MDB1086066.1 hypothetical protein [Streptomyces sp. ACA25]